MLLLAAVIMAAGMLWVMNRTSSGPAAPSDSAVESAVTLTRRDLWNALTRTGIRPDGQGASVEVLLASPQFYEVTGREPPAAEGPSLVFMVAETVHAGELPKDLPLPLVRADGADLPEPLKTQVLASSQHHRTTVFVYPFNQAAQPQERVQMVFPGPDGVESAGNVLTWEMPIEYTPDFASNAVALDVAETGAEPTSRGASGLPSFTWAAILAIMAGMLVALSPCLLSLGVYYTSVLAGAGGEQGQPETGSVAIAGRHVIQTGVFFSLGFTLVYTAGGAAAGFVGQSLEHLGLLTTWVRPLSVVAGAIILLMALRVAWNARSPVVCKLPLSPIFGRARRTGPMGAAIMGFTFAGGCLSCFSATVLPALLLYASAVGSVLYGALLLMVFSLGISVPALALAFGVSRIEPLLYWLRRNNPKLGLASAAVMAGFGVLMVTYQFHIATGLLASWLEL